MKRKIDNPDRSRVKRLAAQAAGAELGFIAGDVPGAVYGAVYAGRAYDYRFPSQVEGPEELDPIKTMGYTARIFLRFKKP